MLFVVRSARVLMPVAVMACGADVPRCFGGRQGDDVLRWSPRDAVMVVDDDVMRDDGSPGRYCLARDVPAALVMPARSDFRVTFNRHLRVWVVKHIPTGEVLSHHETLAEARAAVEVYASTPDDTDE
jgi:hypothetical protein